jgi:apolipoprotein N-acyltransferase
VRNIAGSAWLLAIASGILQAVIFPSPNLYFLCWIAITPLLLALSRTTPGTVQMPESLGQGLLPATAGKAFVLAWVSGTVWSAGTCFWIFHVMHRYGDLDVLTSLGVLLLFCLALGAHTGIFGLLFSLVVGPKRERRSSLTRALMFSPFLWVATETYKTKVLGFPWLPLGTAQVDNLPLSRIATVTGVYGISFEIMLINSAFAAAFLLRRPQRGRMLAATVVAALAVQLSVFIHPPALPAQETARLVQENIPILDQWSTERFQQTLNDLREDSVPTQANTMPGEPLPSVIVWPESPAPFFINDERFREAVSAIARQANAYMIVGSVGTNAAPQMRQPENIYNSAALITPTGQWAARYDKIHLVPFGEYVPFQALLGSFVTKLTRDVGNFVPGTTRNVFNMGRYKAGVFICYESIFPDEIRQFAANGGNVFFNISNDGWFGYYGAPQQHLNQARMRAIENNRWLLRATNTGITGSIDPFGRVVVRAPRDVRTVLDAPFGINYGTTFYTRHGDWFPYLCAIICLGAVILGLRTRYSK